MRIIIHNKQRQRKTIGLRQVTMIGMILITIVGLMEIFFSPQSPPDLSERHLLEADSIATRVDVLP
ncbi:MAG: hypothetical protein AAF927_06000 [Bacteroidota bacterium]